MPNLRAEGFVGLFLGDLDRSRVLGVTAARLD
jgi:hypothetical protein